MIAVIFEAGDFVMKRLLIGISAAASLIATGAFAADLPAKAPLYTKAPVYVDPVYDWTGFYVGGNVGYSWGNSSGTQTLTDPGPPSTLLNSAATKFHMDGVIGGGQLGYNWQRDRWVFGLEADIQASRQAGNGSAVCAGGTAAALNSLCALGHLGDTVPFNVPAFPVTGTLAESLDWFGTVRGRIGPTITPTILAYVTGGLAYGEVSASNTVGGFNITGPQGTNGSTITPFTGAFSNSTLKVGWTVGVGVEGVISGNWTAKLEYLYIDLGNVSGSFATPLIAPSGAFATSSYSSHITDNIVRVGINYRFSGPVVAKY
jgi:outer membrane immunogenic protein